MLAPRGTRCAVLVRDVPRGWFPHYECGHETYMTPSHAIYAVLSREASSKGPCHAGHSPDGRTKSRLDELAFQNVSQGGSGPPNPAASQCLAGIEGIPLRECA